jgi:hypothetical protein
MSKTPENYEGIKYMNSPSDLKDQHLIVSPLAHSFEYVQQAINLVKSVCEYNPGKEINILLEGISYETDEKFKPGLDVTTAYNYVEAFINYNKYGSVDKFAEEFKSKLSDKNTTEINIMVGPKFQSDNSKQNNVIYLDNEIPEYLRDNLLNGINLDEIDENSKEEVLKQFEDNLFEINLDRSMNLYKKLILETLQFLKDGGHKINLYTLNGREKEVIDSRSTQIDNHSYPQAQDLFTKAQKLSYTKLSDIENIDDFVREFFELSQEYDENHKQSDNNNHRIPLMLDDVEEIASRRKDSINLIMMGSAHKEIIFPLQDLTGGKILVAPINFKDEKTDFQYNMGNYYKLEMNPDPRARELFMLETLLRRSLKRNPVDALENVSEASIRNLTENWGKFKTNLIDKFDNSKRDPDLTFGDYMVQCMMDFNV